MAKSDSRSRELIGYGAGVLVAVALTLVGTQLHSSSAELKFVASLEGLLVALIVALVVRIIDGENKAAAAALSTEQRIMDRIHDLEEEALPFVSGLASVPAIAGDIQVIVESAASTKENHSDFLSARLNHRIQEFKAEVIRMADEGTFKCETRDEEFGLISGALNSAHESVRAVAALGYERWNQPEWFEYFGWYIDHAKRHPEIRHSRIFLLRREEALIPEMIRILERHEAAGIHTFALDIEKVDSRLDHAVVLFDEKLLVQHVERKGSHVEVTFTDVADEISVSTRHFDALLRFCESESACLWPKQQQSRIP
jgi:hypothetical protein